MIQYIHSKGCNRNVGPRGRVMIPENRKRNRQKRMKNFKEKNSESQEVSHIPQLERKENKI